MSLICLFFLNSCSWIETESAQIEKVDPQFIPEVEQAGIELLQAEF